MKNEKSRTLNVDVIYSSNKQVDFNVYHSMFVVQVIVHELKCIALHMEYHLTDYVHRIKEA